jgi:hypothetical protein
MLQLVNAAAAGGMYGLGCLDGAGLLSCSVGFWLLHADWLATCFMLQPYQHAAFRSLDWLSACAMQCYAGFCSIACLPSADDVEICSATC